MKKSQLKFIFLFAITITAITILFTFPPIKQNENYHHFADAREINGIDNCCNVISNFPFIAFGIWGLLLSFKKRINHSLQYVVFFLGILLTGFGSSYYHLNPNLNTLVWDRLPMTITFMAFFSLIIGDFIQSELEEKIVWHLVFIGLLSVCYWHYTEALGKGDLRFYILVQFLPLLLIPIIILLFQQNKTTSFYYWLIIFAYTIAKLFETFDSEIFLFTNQISGHTIKHLFASLSALILCLKIKQQQQLTL